MKAITVEPRKPETARLEDRSARSVSNSREIQDTLRRVCQFIGIDIPVLWQWSGTAPRVVTPTHPTPS